MSRMKLMYCMARPSIRAGAYASSGRSMMAAIISPITSALPYM